MGLGFEVGMELGFKVGIWRLTLGFEVGTWERIRV
jgi:hypothetical protein